MLKQMDMKHIFISRDPRDVVVSETSSKKPLALNPKS